MRAVFVTNQRRTELYLPVARRLQELGVEIFWISVSERWTHYLLEAGWPADTILSLPHFGPEWSGDFVPTSDDHDRMAWLEKRSCIAVKNILIMDREFARRPGLRPEAYAHVVTREIDR